MLPVRGSGFGLLLRLFPFVYQFLEPVRYPANVVLRQIDSFHLGRVVARQRGTEAFRIERPLVERQNRPAAHRVVDQFARRRVRGRIVEIDDEVGLRQSLDQLLAGQRIVQRDLSRDAAWRFADHFAEAGIEIVDVQVEPEIRIERREKVEKELRVADALVETAGIGEYGLRMGRIRKSADGAQVESLRNDPDPVAVDV